MGFYSLLGLSYFKNNWMIILMGFKSTTVLDLTPCCPVFRRNLLPLSSDSISNQLARRRQQVERRKCCLAFGVMLLSVSPLLNSKLDKQPARNKLKK
jgi:hypothetical protein